MRVSGLLRDSNHLPHQLRSVLGMNTSQLARLVASNLFFILLASCGGGGGGSGPPSGLIYSSPPILIVGTAMTPLAPTVSGTVSSYAASPALPAGLSLDGSTGVISGTPKQAAAYNLYVVTASNASGKTIRDVPIQVVNGLYPSSIYTFTVGITARTISPTQLSVATSSWSVTPALPGGLSMNSMNGEISGTPTAAQAAGAYAASSTSSGGTSTQSLTLAVAAAPLLDLGHASAVNFARLVNPSLLTQDDGGHWVLWNYATGQTLVNGTASAIITEFLQALPVDLEGTTVVIQTSITALEVRAAADGHVLSEIATTPSWWKLASDGSYVCAGSSSGLTAWSPAGAVLFTRSGDYSKAIAFAAPGQIQVALGAAGSTVIETLSVPGGASSLGLTFQGQFQSWFTDGGKFFTALGSTVWVYSNASVQQDLASLPTLNQLTGQGNWYWTTTLGISGSPTLTLYPVGSKGTATATYPLYKSSVPVGEPGGWYAVPSAGMLALLIEGTAPTTGQVTVLDLSGAMPVATTSTTPIDGLTGFAAASSTTWIVGNGDGVLYDGASPAGQPRYLDYGRATSIAGSISNAVIATASGRILYFDAATHALQGTINLAAWQIAASSDGSVLAAASGGSTYSTTQPPLSITLYSLPGGSMTNTFSSPTLTNMDLSGSGAVLGESFYTAAPCLAQAVPTMGTATLWCGKTNVGLPALSPDGTLVAVSPLSTAVGGGDNGTTNIYLNGALVTAVNGAGVVWIDNDTLLTNSFSYNGMTGFYEYTGASLYSSMGQLKGSPPLPHLGPVQAISSTSVYDGTSNAIYSLTTGAATWASGSPITTDIVDSANGSPNGALSSAVSGSYVVFESGNLILAEPY
jgi:hypothetical protein